MKALINSIKITDRVRKEVTKIDELAANIQTHGLLNPITVMSLEGGEFQLLAGLRRLRAVESLGQIEIAINIVAPADAEAEIRIEISENEQREPFTFSEKMDFARLLEDIEREKSLERKSLGGKGGLEQDTPHGAYVKRGETREIVAEKIGMGKTSYDRAKYIAENAPEEIIEELDKGQRSIRGTYEELKAKENSDKIETDPETAKKQLSSDKLDSPPPYHPGLLSKSDEEAAEKLKTFNAMSPQDKIQELKRQLKEERVRAANAESELSRLKELHHNAVYHKDGIIQNLSVRLEKAEARVEELEAQYCSSAVAK